MSNRFFNFNFLAPVDADIIGGPKFKLVGPAPAERSLAETFLYPNRVLYHLK